MTSKTINDIPEETVGNVTFVVNAEAGIFRINEYDEDAYEAVHMDIKEATALRDWLIRALPPETGAKSSDG